MYDTEARDKHKCPECGHDCAAHLPGMGGCATRIKATNKLCVCELTEAQALRLLLEKQSTLLKEKTDAN